MVKVAPNGLLYCENADGNVALVKAAPNELLGM